MSAQWRGAEGGHVTCCAAIPIPFASLIDSPRSPGHRPRMFTVKPSPFKPRSDSGWPVAAIVLAVVACLGAYTYLSRVTAHNAAPRALSRPAMAQSERRNDLPGERERSTAVVVAPSPALIAPRTEPSRVSADARATIYFCKSYAGGTFWSDTTCSTQRATIDRMTSVPASLPFAQQVAIARGEAQEAARLYESPQPVSATAIESAAPARNRSAMCDIYAQQVHDLDAEARRPQSAARQDQIRAERMDVMSARARERC